MTRSPVSPRRAAVSARHHRVCALRGASVRFADRTVLTGVDLVVGPRERIAVIGDNGSGKSTLLHALAGLVPLSAGERAIDLPGGLALAEQRPAFTAGATVTEAIDLLLADIRGLEGAVRSLSEQLAAAGSDGRPSLLEQLGAAMDRFEARNGYELDQRLDAALDQLSLGALDRSRPVASLSGGERARLALAAAVSAEAELLMLDEPTNDLDDRGVAWLEERLASHRGALVMVTHDRVFLDRFASDVVCVEAGSIRRYGDGYAGYLAAREAERRRLLDAYETWRRELRRNEALVASNAFRVDAIPRKQERDGFGHGAFRARSRDHGAVSRVRQAKERVSRLRDAPAAKPAEPLRFSPVFVRPAATGETDAAASPNADGEASSAALPVLAVEGAVLDGSPHDGGPAGPRLEVDAFEVQEGERWLVVGPNGAGKTTLLRLLAGELAPQRGSVRRRPGLRAAWLRQDLVGDERGTLVDAFARSTAAYREDAAEALLSLGLFAPRDLERPLQELSIGQRRRFELAVAVTVPSDLLLLDEPTNHLSPDLVEQLERALIGYPGAVLTVTHDRRWRERTAAAGAVRSLRVAPGGAVRVER